MVKPDVVLAADHEQSTNNQLQDFVALTEKEYENILGCKYDIMFIDMNHLHIFT